MVVSQAEVPPRCPVPEEQLAWRYLLPAGRIRRCNEVLEVFSVRLGHRLLEVDILLPSSTRGCAKWMVPVAFLGKEPIAPDLKVSDAAGSRIPVPTMRENMAMTCAAIRLIAAEKGIQLKDCSPELISQIIFEESFEAEAALWILEEEVPEVEQLFPLLEKLIDQFLLWVPLQGDPDSDHQVSIARRAPRDLDPILRPGTEEATFSYERPYGSANFLVEMSTASRHLDLGQIAERLLLAFGLRSIEVGSELVDTSRFASYHHCVRAPRGFVVREIRIGGAGDADADNASRFEEIDPGPGLLVQGHDSEIAHVHCSREKNPEPLFVRTTLSTAAHLTSLWAFVVALTAALLWVFEHQGLAVADEAGGRLEVAAGALLLVPTLAAAWAIRSDEGAAMRMVLSGTRVLLLLCGVLAVFAVLTLASVLPEQFGPIAALSLYATTAYFAAVVVIAGWVLSLRPTWYLYKRWLRLPSHNYRATAILAALATLATILAPLVPTGRFLCAFALFVVGLGFVAVAANRNGTRLFESRGPAPRIAAVAAVVAFVGAGHWLGYFGVPSALILQVAMASVFVLLAGAACFHCGLFAGAGSAVGESKAQAGGS